MQRILVERELGAEGATSRSPTRAGRRVTVNLAESPLTWLHSRGHLSDRQLDAGERLRSDWEQANLAPSVTMRWDAVRTRSVSGSGSGLEPWERQIAARKRFDDALNAVGPGLADILWRVVCAGEGVPNAEKALKWPARSGKLVLGLALDRLVDYYRIP